MKRVGLPLLFVVLLVIGLAALFHVPFIFGLCIALLWPLVGLLVTEGFAMPRQLIFLAALESVIVAVIILFPQVRTYGF